MKKYRREIVEAFLNIGIFIDDNEEMDELLLSDFVENSLSFISFIVELEQGLNIEIPDEYLLQGKLEKFADIEKMLDIIIA